MTEQELDQLIKEGQDIIAQAEKSIAAQQKLSAQLGVSSDFFADVMNSNQCPSKLKELIERERAAVMAESQAQASQPATSGTTSSKIGTRKDVTRI